MARKKLVGTEETMTLEEAMSFRDKAMTEFLFHMHSLVQEAVEDEEERANADVNLATKLGNVMSLSELVGILMDPDDYVQGLPGKAEVVEDGE